jgi:hypothetical protein
VSLVKRRDIDVLTHVAHWRNVVSREHALTYESQRIVAINGSHADPETSTDRWLLSLGEVEFILHTRLRYQPSSLLDSDRSRRSGDCRR